MILDTIFDFIKTTGIVNMDYKSAIMIGVAILFLYLAIHHGFEPLLLVPIAFGMLLSNSAGFGMFDEGGLFYWFYQLNKMGILPPLIFMGVGAMTDFGPLIANPRSLLMGAGAQFGIFTSFLGAILLAGFNAQEAASIGIIGGADGPTAIFLTTKLAPHLLGAIAVSAYSYMALVPVIQPPIMRLLTTKKERTIKMEQLRFVSQREKVIFPIMFLQSYLDPPRQPSVGC